MLAAEAPGLELAGGLSRAVGSPTTAAARFSPWVWQTTAAVAAWLVLDPAVCVVVGGELAVAALLRLLVLLYLVPPRARPLGASTSMLSDTADRQKKHDFYSRWVWVGYNNIFSV